MGKSTDDYELWLEMRWKDVGIDLTSEQQKRIQDYEEAIKTSDETGELRGYTEEYILADLLDEENDTNLKNAKDYYRQKIEATFGGTKGVDHRVKLTNELLSKRTSFVERKVDEITTAKAREIRTKIENKRESISKATGWRERIQQAKVRISDAERDDAEGTYANKQSSYKKFVVDKKEQAEREIRDYEQRLKDAGFNT